MIINVINQYHGVQYSNKIQEFVYIATGNMHMVKIPSTISSLRPYLYASKWIGKEGVENQSGELVIPSNITEIGEHCFDDCGVSKISFQGNIKKLPNHCFMSAYDLQTVDFPNGLEELGDSCFESAIKLKSLRIPSTVKKLGQNLIKDSGISELYLPSSLKSIPTGAFNFSGNLVKIHIPEGVEVFEANCFKSIGYSATDVIDIILPKSTKRIETGAFSEIGSETAGIRVYLPVACEVQQNAFNSNIKLFDCTEIDVTSTTDTWFQEMFAKKDYWGVYGVGSEFYFKNYYWNSDDWNLYPYSATKVKTTWGATAYAQNMGGE